MIIPDDHALLVTSYTATGNSEPKSFTMGCFVDGLGASALDVANRFSDIWKARAQAQCANEVTIGTTTAYWRQGTTLLVGVSDRAPYAGTLGVGAASPAVSFLLRKGTGLAGRKFRGRMFVPQPRDADVDSGGNVLAAQLTNWATKGVQIIDDMNDDGVVGFAIRPRLLHSDATAPTEITTLVCDPIVGTQRRRQR